MLTARSELDAVGAEIERHVIGRGSVQLRADINCSAAIDQERLQRVIVEVVAVVLEKIPTRGIKREVNAQRNYAAQSRLGFGVVSSQDACSQTQENVARARPQEIDVAAELGAGGRDAPADRVGDFRAYEFLGFLRQLRGDVLERRLPVRGNVRQCADALIESVDGLGRRVLDLVGEAAEVKQLLASRTMHRGHTQRFMASSPR